MYSMHICIMFNNHNYFSHHRDCHKDQKGLAVFFHKADHFIGRAFYSLQVSGVSFYLPPAILPFFLLFPYYTTSLDCRMLLQMEKRKHLISHLNTRVGW